ncbi:hypothetical protein [Erythrobacter sp. Dej080120_24]|uniref:hypothetical protein n=1 Tax=Erythrobacter sp. Dej080120_24 TaxID=3024837 RepID=UPI0030C71EBC
MMRKHCGLSDALGTQTSGGSVRYSRSFSPWQEGAKFAGFAIEPLGFIARSMLDFLRSWIAARLGIKDRSARDGSWWEIDLILVFLGGVCALGIFAVIA